MARFFQKVNMKSETTKSMNRSGIYVVGSTPTAVSSGAICVPTGLAPSVYGAGLVDFNKFTFATEATLTAGIPVFVADIVKVSEAVGMGNTYRIGAKTIGLSAAAGEVVAWRELGHTDQFYLGAENFVTAPTVGQFAKRTVSSVDYTPSATLGATGFHIKIDAQEIFSEGSTASTPVYLCRVVQL